MDMDTAAVFLAGSILYALGFLVILVAVVIANNIIKKHWQSFGWKFFPTWINEHNARFASQEELNRIAPTLEKNHADNARTNG